jgi:hypothetical protein
MKGIRVNMKREMIRLLALFAFASLMATGCYSHRTVVVHERARYAPEREVIVMEAPPAPRREIIEVAPSTRHIWIEGYWVRRGDRWAWVKGHYEVRPSERAHWVAGHWDHTPRGWVWTPGHWD